MVPSHHLNQCWHIVYYTPWGQSFNWIWIEIQQFSLKKIHSKVSSAKWQPSCLSINVLKIGRQDISHSNSLQGAMLHCVGDDACLRFQLHHQYIHSIPWMPPFHSMVDCFTLLLARHLADVSCYIGPSMPSGICMEIHTEIVQKRKKKPSHNKGTPRQPHVYL